MKPKIEMRIKDYVVVLMLRVETLRLCDDVNNLVTWADNYDVDSDEHKCFELAKNMGACVNQVYAEINKVRFYFRFKDEETAKNFCKELEAENCK